MLGIGISITSTQEQKGGILGQAGEKGLNRAGFISWWEPEKKNNENFATIYIMLHQKDYQRWGALKKGCVVGVKGTGSSDCPAPPPK